MNEQVAALARQGRLVEAAALARANGDMRATSELLERACDFPRAAEAAMEAGDPGRALALAAMGGSTGIAERALRGLETDATRQELITVATGLSQRGQYAWAARAYEAACATDEAADAWESAGDGVRAARLLEAVDGKASNERRGPARAARMLESLLRREPDRADVLLALGDLLLRYGKATAALRTLQRVADGAPEKRDALRLSLRALGELGMADAKADVAARLSKIPASEPRVAWVSHEPVALPSSPVRARLYGRYEILREVSSTATARVLECRDTVREERVAVKLFSAQTPATEGAGRDALAHFLREARVLAELAHPNIVRMIDVLEQGPALVLEWMPGGTLEQRLAVDPLDPARAVEVACSILRALGEGHRLGVVHRDLKPANILFDAAGAPRLSDFGVAHMGDLSVTATAGSFGSLAYMSPEQREGRPATAQSDIFSLGVVLLEMLTGRRPRLHERRSDGAALDVSLTHVHRHLDARHDRAVARLFERDPAKRPADAFAAARSLSDLPWPESRDASREVPSPGSPLTVRPAPERLETDVQHDDMARDGWLGRRVTRVVLSERSLARLATFARVGDRALQPVLRVDRDAGFAWLGVPRGQPLARPLESAERETLERALARLHGEDFVHGSIDRASVFVDETGPTLLFPPDDGAGEPGTSTELDRSALGRL